MFDQTTDTLTSVSLLDYVRYWHSYRICHITIILHVNDLTLISGGAQAGV